MCFGKLGFNSPNYTKKKQRYKTLTDRQTNGRADRHQDKQKWYLYLNQVDLV